MLLSEGLLLMAKQVQSKLPASCPGQEAPSNIWIWELIGSSIARKAGMGAWVPGPSVQAGIERNHRGKPRDQGNPGWGGREAGAKSFQEQRGSQHGLSIPLSLHGRGRHHLAGGTI